MEDTKVRRLREHVVILQLFYTSVAGDTAAISLLHHVLVPPDTEMPSGHQNACSLSLLPSNILLFLKVLVFSAKSLILLDLSYSCGECGMDVLWILTGLNTSAVLLWDMWGVISVQQPVSSPVEISHIHIPFSMSRE